MINYRYTVRRKIMLERVASYIWGTGLLVLLLGTGLCLSFRLRFFQFWGWKTILRRTFGSLRTKSGKGGTSLTQFQTFSTALAAAMGTGNILGVAAALCLAVPVQFSGCGYPPCWAWL